MGDRHDFASFAGEFRLRFFVVGNPFYRPRARVLCPVARAPQLLLEPERSVQFRVAWCVFHLGSSSEPSSRNSACGRVALLPY